MNRYNQCFGSGLKWVSNPDPDPGKPKLSLTPSPPPPQRKRRNFMFEEFFVEVVEPNVFCSGSKYI
jgi:hypothetical protein